MHCVLHHPKIDCLPLPASLISQQTMLYSILYICTITSQPMNRVSAPVAPPSRTYRLQIDRLLVLHQSRSVMACKCISKLPRLRSPNSLDHGFQSHLQTRSTAASKCISELAQSRPPSASPNSLDHGLQVHLQTRSIMASKCISKLARLQLPSASPNSLNRGLQCISKFAQLRH